MCIQLYAAFLVSVSKWAEKPAGGALVRLKKKKSVCVRSGCSCPECECLCEPCGTSLRGAASFSPAWTAVHQGKWCCALEKVYVIIQDKCVYVCEQSGNERVQIGYLCVQVCVCVCVSSHAACMSICGKSWHLTNGNQRMFTVFCWSIFCQLTNQLSN